MMKNKMRSLGTITLTPATIVQLQSEKLKIAAEQLSTLRKETQLDALFIRNSLFRKKNRL